MRTARTIMTALALTATLALAACGEDEPETEATSTTAPTETVSESPTETATPSPSEPAAAAAVEVTIQGDAVSPMAQALEVEVGEPVVLDVTSDRAGELHAHSNPEQTVALEEGQQTVEMTFDKPGQVDIEEHESGALILRVLVR